MSTCIYACVCVLDGEKGALVWRVVVGGGCMWVCMCVVGGCVHACMRAYMCSKGACMFFVHVDLCMHLRVVMFSNHSCDLFFYGCFCVIADS